jgi:hypothetical protein
MAAQDHSLIGETEIQRSRMEKKETHGYKKSTGKRKEWLQPGRYNGQNSCKGPKTGRYETFYEMAGTIAG